MLKIEGCIMKIICNTIFLIPQTLCYLGTPCSTSPQTVDTYLHVHIKICLQWQRCNLLNIYLYVLTRHYNWLWVLFSMHLWVTRLAHKYHISAYLSNKIHALMKCHCKTEVQQHNKWYAVVFFFLLRFFSLIWQQSNLMSNIMLWKK